MSPGSGVAGAAERAASQPAAVRFAGWPALLAGSGLPGCSGGGQCPGAVLAGQAAADEGAQVDRGGAAFEPGVVAGRSAVAQLDPPAAAGGDLGDRAFHVGPVPLVVLAQARADGAAGTGLREDYMRHRPNVERAIAQVATWRGRRLKLRYRGVTKNDAWLKRRTAALNLRNLTSRGLARQDGAWVLAT